MLLNTAKKQYRVVREVLSGETNDVYVCQEQDVSTAPYKIIWLVKNRWIARELMGSPGDMCEECFMHNENAGFVFGYGGERLLDRFYQSTIQSEAVSESRVWLQLVVRCMTSGLPPAVLNMILKQKQIHIGADGDIWFGYFLDLSEYDGQAGEKENVTLCAAYITQLIEYGLAIKADAAKSIHVMNLIQKKLVRKKYREFIQLYSDLKLMTRERSSGNQKGRLKAVVASRQDLIYRILALCCIVLVCIVILMVAGHLLFGEFSFWKLLRGPLDQVGTESLLQ